MLTVHTVFFSPALVVIGAALSGMLWTFATKAHKSFKNFRNS